MQPLACLTVATCLLRCTELGAASPLAIFFAAIPVVDDPGMRGIPNRARFSHGSMTCHGTVTLQITTTITCLHTSCTPLDQSC